MDNETPITSTPPIELDVRLEGRAVVVTVSGELDLLTAPAFEQALRRALAGRPPLVVVDLGGVGFLDSSALAVLATTHHEAGQDTVVRLVATAPVVVRPLELTGLSEVLPVLATVEEALTP